MKKTIKTVALLAWLGSGLLLLLTILQLRGALAPDLLERWVGRAPSTGVDESPSNEPRWPVVEADPVSSTEASLPEGRAFLGFRLPAEGFSAQRRLRYEIIPELSRVGFDAVTPIDTFSAVSSTVRGYGEARPADPQARPHAQLVVETSSLSTGDPGRDQKLRDGLKADRHPEICFALDSFETGRLDLRTMSLTGRALCTMRVCGGEHRLEVPVEMKIDSAGRLVMQGEVPLSLSEMGVEVDTALGIPVLSDEIKMWFGIRGRLAKPMKASAPTLARELADAR